jgi:hypothetical protein
MFTKFSLESLKEETASRSLVYIGQGYIKMDLRKISWEKVDKNSWLAVVNTTMNIQVP